MFVGAVALVGAGVLVGGWALGGTGVFDGLLPEIGLCGEGWPGAGRAGGLVGRIGTGVGAGVGGTGVGAGVAVSVGAAATTAGRRVG